MLKRTKATSIPPDVKRAVYSRDGGACVLCGRHAYPGWACAHYIARSHGGLGIEKNILTLCPDCHRAYDEGPRRKEIRAKLKAYLVKHYGDFDDKELIYRKWTEAQ